MGSVRTRTISEFGPSELRSRSGNTWRQIFLDGRELGDNVLPAYLGYSTGKWDGDTLVVDTRGFNGKTWLDQTGKPTSEALHVTERFRRTDFGHMEIQITIDDPDVYTKPWQVKIGRAHV